jgi:hypothetical protein
MNMAKRGKSFFSLTPAERDAAVAKYDRGVQLDETSPLTAAERARFERARAVKVRPVKEDDKAQVLISVDPKLLARAHTRARREGKTFSALVGELLRAAERRAS